MQHWRPALALGLVLATSGCGARAWRHAQALDEPAGYHRFLREHGDSVYAEEARQRLQFARLRADPSYERFLAFRARYPGDARIAELIDLVERSRFDAARSAGSAEGYHAFVEDFPDSPLRARALGNATYLEARGFETAPSALADFAAEYPESDYAAGARRSIALVERARWRLARVGLVMELPTSLPGREQLRRDFRDRARRAWQPLGVEVVEVQTDQDLAVADLPALLRIQHREEGVPASMRGGVMRPPGVLAQTSVLLEHGDTPEHVWRRSFELRVRASERRLDSSILHVAGARDFWQGFFVPVARWPTGRAVHAPLRLSSDPVAVDLEGSRVAVLSADGSFEVHDIADAAGPIRVAQYRRPRDLASYDGIRLRGQRVVIYGADGIEVVSLTPEGARRERQFGRETLGAVRGVAFLEASMVAATTRGLLEIGDDVAPRVWMEGAMRGVVVRGTHLLFGDDAHLFSARPQDLDEGRVEGSLRFPRGLEGVEFHAEGSRLVVLGRRGAVWVDVDDPARLRLHARVDLRDVGRVSDAADVGGHLLLLGDRGLQVLDAAGARVVESLDVQARQRFGLWGRHAALVGDGQMQVVDLTPFLGGWTLAEETPRSVYRTDSMR